MRKLAILLAALLLAVPLNAQQPGEQKADEISFPSKYALALFANEALSVQGRNKQLAAHWQNQGGGLFTWRKFISHGGNYEISVSYATRQAGTVVKVFTERKDSVTAELPITSGYYNEGDSWYQFNCERRKIPGVLYLHRGQHLISLQLITKGAEQQTVIYNLELLPVNKKARAEKERVKALASHSDVAWFARMPYGVMFHWTSQTAPEKGPDKPYEAAVDDFDVPSFVRMIEETGAGYVILTTNHAEPYFPAPLKDWEKEYRHHTTKRDLIREIGDSLQKHDIRLFLYLASHVYARFDKVNDREFRRLNYKLIREIGKRYGKVLAGYWFDGWYQCEEKHPEFDFRRFYHICKTGNPQRLVCFNSWLYPIVTLWQDYWAGEVYSIGSPPQNRILSRGPGEGLQSHSLIVMEKEGWIHTAVNTKIPKPSVTAHQLIDFITKSEGKGPVTVNIQIYQDGSISPEALEIMKQVKKALKKKGSGDQ